MSLNDETKRAIRLVRTLLEQCGDDDKIRGKIIAEILEGWCPEPDCGSRRPCCCWNDQ